MGARTTLAGEYKERSTSKITATLEDSDGTAIAQSSLTTLTLTLYDEFSGTIINSKDGANVLTSLDESGNLSLTLVPADMQIINTTRADEMHIALMRWTYPSSQGGNQEIAFKVKNMTKVTS